MRGRDRHRLVGKIQVTQDLSLSDHKPVTISIRIGLKTNRVLRRMPPKINAEILRSTAAKAKFKEYTEEKYTNQGDWDFMAKVLTDAAKEVCGTTTKQVENPWILGNEAELTDLHKTISDLVIRRNEALSRRENTKDITKELQAARRTMKRRLKQLEEEWWQKLIDECKEAADKGDLKMVYTALRRIGLRGCKPAESGSIDKETFKEHFEEVSKERFEERPNDILQRVREMGDYRLDPKHMEANDVMNRTPDENEIIKCIAEVKDSAPGRDGVRISYIREACEELKKDLISLIQRLFITPADTWEDTLKVGQIIPLHKKNSRKDPNNYRGVCLLAMGSRILARIIAKRLRWWSETLGLTDDNQSGFRPNRSTADSTQIIIRIEEDIEDLIRRQRQDNKESTSTTPPGPQGRLLDLRKAYPRVNRPAMWLILELYGLRGPCMETIIGLHEATAYCVRGQDGESEFWHPQRGLREGCSTSPALFNLYHQVVMRRALEERLKAAEQSGMEVGIPWRWKPGSRFPNKSEEKNSETRRELFHSVLFADDTTVLGTSEEIQSGVEITKKVMNWFEERSNDDKEKYLKFGDEESKGIRMLGCWVGRNHDTKNRKKRAGAAWAKVKTRLRKTLVSKRFQAKITEVCVESCLLFDSATRSWSVSEINQLQKFMDKCYRHIWSNKRGPPLKEMQKAGMNMQDVRNSLDVKSIRWKIEKRSLERLGHVMRMEDQRTTKAAILGWYEELENRPKTKGHKQKTVLYWRKLVREAGMDWLSCGEIATDRMTWKAKVRKRMEHLEKWERSKGHKPEEEVTERNWAPTSDHDLECKSCGKICKSRGGLRIHEKRMHETAETTFKCDKCSRVFKSLNTLKNHMKTHGEKITPTVYQPKTATCDQCGKSLSASNMARHKNRHCTERRCSPSQD